MYRFVPRVLTSILAYVLAGSAAIGLAACGLFEAGVDERAPRVELLGLAPHDTVGGTVLLHISAESFGGQNDVSFITVRLDDEPIGEAERVEGERPVGETALPFIFRWNSVTVPDGVHELEAVAFDAYGSRGLSAALPVVTRNESSAPGPPSVILTPTEDANVSGRVSVIASVAETGAAGARMDFLVDGVTVHRTARGPFLFAWDTEDVEPGPHILQLRTYSAPGVFSYSAPVEVNVTRDPTDGQTGTTTPGLPRFLTTGFSGDVQGSVAVGFNNDLYLATLADTLYAYSPTGTLRWAYGTGGPLRSAPVIDGNENLFVASDDGHIYGLDPMGRALWRAFEVGARPSMPALGVAGDLYFGDALGRLHRFDTFSGTAYAGWPRTVAEAGIVAPPVIAEDGTVVVATLGGGVHAVDGVSGEERWSTTDLGAIQSGLALAASPGAGRAGTVVYAISGDGVLHALGGADGAIRWQYQFGAQTGAVRAAPVIGPDGTVYVGTGTGLIALTPAGALKGRFAARDVGTAAIDLDGNVYFVSGDRLHGIRSNNTPMWSFDLQGSVHGPVTLRRDGALLVAADNGVLYAVHAGTSGLARSNWPTFQRNARHSGRIGSDSND